MAKKEQNKKYFDAKKERDFPSPFVMPILKVLFMGLECV